MLVLVKTICKDNVNTEVRLAVSRKRNKLINRAQRDFSTTVAPFSKEGSSISIDGAVFLLSKGAADMFAKKLETESKVEIKSPSANRTGACIVYRIELIEEL